MSKVTDSLSEVGIHNPHNYSARARDLGGVGVYLSRRPAQRGRASLVAAWQVIRPGYKTDPDGYWRDAGHKTFNIWDYSTPTQARQAARQAAIDWANQRYGTSAWVPGPFRGTLIPVEDKALLKTILTATVDA